MKKLVLLGLALVLCVSLVACGEKQNESKNNHSNEPVIEDNNYVDEPTVEIVPDIVEDEVSGEELFGDEEVSGEVSEVETDLEVSGEEAE